MKESFTPPQSHHSHRKTPTTPQDDKVEYYCKSCKKWCKLSDYSIKEFMCKECLKENIKR